MTAWRQAIKAVRLYIFVVIIACDSIGMLHRAGFCNTAPNIIPITPPHVPLYIPFSVAGALIIAPNLYPIPDPTRIGRRWNSVWLGGSTSSRYKANVNEEIIAIAMHIVLVNRSSNNNCFFLNSL